MTFAEILFSISGYIVHSGAGRLLTPQDYGRYGLIVTLSIMIVTLIGNGIPISMSKYLSEFHEAKPGLVPVIKRKALLLQLILIGLVMSLFFFATPLISSALGDETLTPLLRISIFILPMYAIDTFYFYYFTGIHRFRFQAALKILRSVLRVTMIIGMIWLWKLEGAIAGYIAVPLLVFLAAWAYDYFKVSREFPSHDKTLDFDWMRLLNYAWPITLFMIFYEILISLDLYFVKAILGDDYQTGIYNSALTVARIPYYLFYALNIILLPSISKSTSQNDHARTRQLLSQSLRFMIMTLLPVIVLMAVYAEPLIGFIYGSQYLGAAPSLQILVFGMGFLTIFYMLSFVLSGAGLVRIPMWTALFGMWLNAILNLYLIREYGILGAAIATSISSVVILVSTFMYTSKRLINDFLDFKSLSRMLLASILLYFASFLFPADNLLFIVWSALLTFLYFVLLYVLRETTPDDLKMIKELFQKKKKEA